MKTFKIIHREELVGWFYEEAETAEEALDKFHADVSAGKIDFSDMEMADGEDTVEEEEPICLMIIV